MSTALKMFVTAGKITGKSNLTNEIGILSNPFEFVSKQLEPTKFSSVRHRFHAEYANSLSTIALLTSEQNHGAESSMSMPWIRYLINSVVDRSVVDFKPIYEYNLSAPMM